MYNRNHIVEKLIKIRREIYQKEISTDKPPSQEDTNVKKELDQLILGVIGDFLSRDDQEQVDKILMKAICSDISVEMAMVAIREIVFAYYSTTNNTSRKESKESKNQLAATAFKEGYR